LWSAGDSVINAAVCEHLGNERIEILRRLVFRIRGDVRYRRSNARQIDVLAGERRGVEMGNGDRGITDIDRRERVED
jgi:hypothetical protein